MLRSGTVTPAARILRRTITQTGCTNSGALKLPRPCGRSFKACDLFSTGGKAGTRSHQIGNSADVEFLHAAQYAISSKLHKTRDNYRLDPDGATMPSATFWTSGRGNSPAARCGKFCSCPRFQLDPCGKIQVKTPLPKELITLGNWPDWQAGRGFRRGVPRPIPCCYPHGQE